MGNASKAYKLTGTDSADMPAWTPVIGSGEVGLVQILKYKLADTPRLHFLVGSRNSLDELEKAIKMEILSLKGLLKERVGSVEILGVRVVQEQRHD